MHFIKICFTFTFQKLTIVKVDYANLRIYYMNVESYKNNMTPLINNLNNNISYCFELYD